MKLLVIIWLSVVLTAIGTVTYINHSINDLVRVPLNVQSAVQSGGLTITASDGSCLQQCKPVNLQPALPLGQ